MFKPGDKVIRINYSWRMFEVGKVYTVKKYHDDYSLCLLEFPILRPRLSNFKLFFNVVKRNLITKGLP